MDQTVRKSRMEGVIVTVNCNKESFDLFIDIDADCKFNKKHNDCFIIKFHNSTTKSQAQNAMRLSITNQKYNRPLINNFKKKLSMPNGMTCTISLYPSFYLSPALLKIFNHQKNPSEKQVSRKKKRKARKEQFYLDFEYGNVRSQNRIGGKPITIYSQNNIFKPYQGGGCCSK